jgi:hypothetical protein
MLSNIFLSFSNHEPQNVQFAFASLLYYDYYYIHAKANIDHYLNQSHKSVTSWMMQCTFSGVDLVVLDLLIMMFFSDANLECDKFLKSLMDEHGWVPVSKIADFNRVRRLFRFLRNFISIILLLC